MNCIFKILFIAILLVLSACSASRNSNAYSEEKTVSITFMKLEGTFQGKDLFVQNPMTIDGGCTEYVEVNGIRVLDSIDVQQTAYQIDLKSLDLDTGDVVKIKIYHRSDCKPKLLNPVVH